MTVEFEYPIGEDAPSIGDAAQLLIDAIGDFQRHKIGYEGLYFGALVVWDGVANNPVLHKIVEEGLEKKRQEMTSAFTVDFSKGDPIQKRYDPNFWMEDIPKKVKPTVYIYDRCKSLLSFLESLDSQK